MKPILFNTDMVRALLEGRKTCTRRVVKPQPKARLAYACMGYKHGTWGYLGPDAWKHWGESYRTPDGLSEDELKRRWNPPYHTDDILYVRETWNCNNFGWHYRADWHDDNCPDMSADDKWRPSIHMPREAARIFLRVTDVRVERLQDITEDGVCDEGAEPLIACKCEHPIYSPEGGIEMCWNTDCCSYCPAIEESYADLFGKLVWNPTIKKTDLATYGWDANPWVWVIEFERCEKPEEE